jgi:hypothetical protein
MRIKVPRKLREHYSRFIHSYLPRAAKPSSVPLSVLVPVAVKDIASARLSIQSIREHLKHPIERIVVVGQDADEIRRICAAEQVLYVNENDVLPRCVHKLDPVVLGNSSRIGRIGWIKQQFIKLNCFESIDSKNILVHDADTFLLRDLVYFEGDRQVFFSSDEYAPSYHRMNCALLGQFKRYARSFIGHGMLFQKNLMNALHQAVETHCGTDFVEAIMTRVDEPNGIVLSEYELYGNFVYRVARERCVVRYWYNRPVFGLPPGGLPQLRKIFPRCNSVSNHIRPGHVPKKRWHVTFPPAQDLPK